MIDITDYKAVRKWAYQLQAEERRRHSRLLAAADHINSEVDRLKTQGKVSANNGEKMRTELFGMLLNTPNAEIPHAYLTPEAVTYAGKLYDAAVAGQHIEQSELDLMRRLLKV